MVPSAPVLLTLVQQVLIGFTRFCCLLQTCERSCHLEIHHLFTKCPGAHRLLFVSLESEEVFVQKLCHLKKRRTVDFFTDSPEQILKSETILVDTCYPISGSGSTSFHLSQQTVAPHVLSPVSVLTFSSHLCTNDTVRRNHRMSLDPRPRLPVCLSISTLLLS